MWVDWRYFCGWIGGTFKISFCDSWDISFCGWIGGTFKINYKVPSQSLDFSLKIHGKSILPIEFNENPMIIDEYRLRKLSVVK